MPTIPTYLMNRNGIWYFNYRIPSSIRNRYNIQKLFIRKSLRTTNVREAVKLSRKYDEVVMANVEKILKLLKKSELTEEEQLITAHYDVMAIGKKIVEEYEDTYKNGTYIEQTDFWMGYSKDEYECYRYAVNKISKEKEWQEQEKKELLKQHAKILVDEFEIRVANNKVKSEEQKQEEETSITLKELIEKFIHYKTKKGMWKERSAKGNTEMLYVIRDFLEYAIEKKNPMIHLFETDHAIKFEDKFCHYPTFCKRDFPTKSMTEIMGMIDSKQLAGVARISTNTYNIYARLLQALFKWAKTDKKGKFLKGENVFVELEKEGEAPKSYSPFTDKEIKLIFNTPLFAKKEFETKFSWRYWVPIIMIYHGMRLEEVAQLLIKNVCENNDVWCFDIRDEFGEDGEIITSTKAKGKNTGQRFVPIHPKVKEIGFLKYVEYQRKIGNEKVFPTLSGRNGKGEYKQSGASVSKWFNEDSSSRKSYLTSVGIDKQKRHVVLYSCKHTVETLLINHPENLEYDKVDLLIGHTIQSIGRKHYGTLYESTILAVVEKVEYPEADLPWDVNESYNDIAFPWE